MAIGLLLALAGCGPAAEVKPVMAPVDHPRPPRGITLRCTDPDWEPIRLPTTAAEQVAGRERDRAAAHEAIETCDGRRARSVKHIRRLGATP